MSPNEVMQELSCSFVHKRLFSAAKGFVTGGPGGALRGFVAGGGRRKQSADTKLAIRQNIPKPISAGRPASSSCWEWIPGQNRWGWMCATGELGITSGCTPPLVMRNGACVSVETVPVIDVDPTRISPAEYSVSGGQAVAGAFGMPAMVPLAESRRMLSCPAGMVLGRDDLCYPKQVLRRDSKFRKWRPGMRPILTGGERHGITKAKRSINKARAAVGLASLK